MPSRRSIALPALAAAVIVVVALLVRQVPAVHHQTPAAAAAVQSGSATVQVTGYAYSPDRITVRAGTRITFTNHDPTAHTATSDNGGFDTMTIAPHSSRTIRITRPGTYPYHCVFHAFMTGTITVVAG